MIVSLTTYVLVVLLVFSVYFDLTQKRIPNFLTFPAILLGLIIFAVSGGWSGLLQGLSGFGVGIAVFFIPFALGGMGAGDVKLMGAIGALKGLEFILYAAFFTALSGGVFALAYLLFSGQLFSILKKVLLMAAVPFFKMLYIRFRNPYFSHLNVYYSAKLESLQGQGKKRINLPYGIAIAVGTILVLVIVNAEVHILPFL